MRFSHGECFARERIVLDDGIEEGCLGDIGKDEGDVVLLFAQIGSNFHTVDVIYGCQLLCEQGVDHQLQRTCSNGCFALSHSYHQETLGVAVPELLQAVIHLDLLQHLFLA